MVQRAGVSGNIRNAPLSRGLSRAAAPPAARPQRRPPGDRRRQLPFTRQPPAQNSQITDQLYYLLLTCLHIRQHLFARGTFY